ncbi:MULTISPECIES: TolC family protein [unclassified Pseudoalteromonas]|uniref:TolC family protein n=1 Tax=unclassified Pseudoalteromonas TaxID=194690 RepID=UPI00301500FC
MQVKSLFVMAAVMAATAQAKVTSLEQAIATAIANDPWLRSSQHRESAFTAKSKAALSYSDPKMSLAVMNLPVDSWELNQEPMTQLKVGVTQMLPRGDSLAIKSEQLRLEASKQPLLQQQRVAQIEREVSLLWLDIVHANNTLALIERDSVLFEQMVDIANASYSSAVGTTRQQDVIRAQLEVVQLDDKKALAYQKLNTAKAKLGQWLMDDNLNLQQATIDDNALMALPMLRSAAPKLMQTYPIDKQALTAQINQHPAVLLADVDSKKAKQEVAMKEQAYQPQFAVNASYAYRDDAPVTGSRADFFSVGVTFDMPLFLEKRQDPLKAAAVAELEASKTQRFLVLKQLFSGLNSEIQTVKRLQQRQTLYRDNIIAQSAEQAEAALSAYTNDDGDFAEVVRARIAKLNAELSALAIDIALLKAVARSNYYLAQVKKDSHHE